MRVTLSEELPGYPPRLNDNLFGNDGESREARENEKEARRSLGTVRKQGIIEDMIP